MPKRQGLPLAYSRPTATLRDGIVSAFQIRHHEALRRSRMATTMDTRPDFTAATSHTPLGHLKAQDIPVEAGAFATDNLGLAQSLARAGIPVFPAQIAHCGDGWRKKPLIRNWQA